MRNKNVKKAITFLGVGLFWLTLWQLAYYAVGRDLLLASPFAVLKKLAVLVRGKDFWLIVGSSFMRIMSGFMLGLVCGILLAVASARWKLVYKILQLPMSIIKATPVASFVILALVWISGRRLSTFISFIMVLPMVWNGVYTGISCADIKLLEAAKTFRLSKLQTAEAVYLPAVMPHLLSASRIALGFAWKSGIAGEVIAIPKNSIGSQLHNAKVYLETDDLFAWTAVVVILSVAIEKLFSAIIRKAAGKWGGENG